MTSDRPRTEAWEQVESVLMNYHRTVSLSDLHPEEFRELINRCLQKVDLRELRGFKPLSSNITWRPGSSGGPSYHTLEIEHMDLAEDVRFSSAVEDFDLKSHTLKLNPGRALESRVFYRRHESSDETEDFNLASSWGRHGYPHSGSFRVLLLRRPRDHSSAEANLVDVICSFEKVPYKHQHLVKSVEARKVSSLAYYGPRVTEEAGVALIKGLCDAYRATHRELQGQVEVVGRELEMWERLAYSVKP